MRIQRANRLLWWAGALSALVILALAVLLEAAATSAHPRDGAAPGTNRPSASGWAQCRASGCTPPGSLGPGMSPSATLPPEPAPVPSPPAAGGAFTHPGVLVSREQLDFVRRQIAAGAQPWRSAFDAMRADPYASLSWVATPRATVECGSASNPNNGCSDEREDALATYTDALMWYLTGDVRYAQLAIKTFDAWAVTVRAHTNSNAPIQAGWSGATFARAGELIRYTYSGWDLTRRNRFTTMLRTIYLPVVLPGEKRSNGNHELIELDAAAGIAVFLDDHAAFRQVVSAWRARIPAYIYLRSDGPLPRPPNAPAMSTREKLVHYWQDQSVFVDGLSQETCRDFGHTGWGLEAATHVAATAWIQGIDLYAEMRTRMTTALEFHAAYDRGTTAPAWLCGGILHTGLGPTLEMVYNHYHRRLGIALPNTGRLVAKLRPGGADYFIAWETLTNADNPYG